MIKKYKIENLNCVNCARKMEEKASKLRGVSSVHINFMTEKIRIEAEDDLFPGIVDDVEKVCQTINEDFEIAK